MKLIVLIFTCLSLSLAAFAETDPVFVSRAYSNINQLEEYQSLVIRHLELLSSKDQTEKNKSKVRATWMTAFAAAIGFASKSKTTTAILTVIGLAGMSADQLTTDEIEYLEKEISSNQHHLKSFEKLLEANVTSVEDAEKLLVAISDQLNRIRKELELYENSLLIKKGK